MHSRAAFPRGGAPALAALIGAAFFSAAVITAEPGLFPRRAAPAPASGTADVSPVTDGMLARPGADQWLMWRGNLASWGHSALEQINTDNVNQLQLVWTRPLQPGPQEGTPLVHDGVLYYPNPEDIIQAIDAASGEIIWEHSRPSPEDIGRYINQPFINRNLAIHGNLIIDTSADGAIYALDARSGKEVWSTQVLDYRRGIHQTSGPIVADGKVFTGRGCEPIDTAGPADCVITAHDALTGKELWRRRTIAAPGEPGNDSWGDVPDAERKHVGTWMPPSYDAELKLLYIGTSVTSPAPKFLLGGNDKQHLYHNSTLALNPDTGEIVWYYQHLIDHWDIDHPFERILVDTEVAPDAGEVSWMAPDIRRGQTYKVLTGIPGKSGIVYTLDRRTGKFLWARPTVYQTLVESIDGRTGAVKVSPKAQFNAKGDKVTVCPNANGGKIWTAGAYSPQTGLMYFPLQNTCSEAEASIASRTERSAYGIRPFGSSIAPGTQNVGTIQAISVETGKTAWKYEQRAATMSLVSTGGGVIFGGDVAGRFRAFDARSGTVLWEVNLGSQVTGYPVSYAVNGRQYVAVSTGQAVSPGSFLGLTPEIRSGQAANLFVFALPTEWKAATLLPRTPPPTGAAIVASQVGAPVVPQSCRKLPAPPANGNRSGANGKFSIAQSTAGKKIYVEKQCVLCHGTEMQGVPGAPPLADVGFRNAWQGRTLRELFECTHDTMPPGRQGSLSDEEYLQLIAAMLEANGFRPAAAGAGLSTDQAALDRIVIGP